MDHRARRPKPQPGTIPPVVPDRRSDPKIRKQMSGPALRTFFNVAEAWKLTNEQQRALLGWPPESTFFKYKSGVFGRCPTTC